LNSIFKKTRIGEPVFLRNLKVYPIKTENSNGFSPATVEETITSGTGEFCELETPEINEIIFVNRGDEAVLMLDGEEITGAFQNRIIGTSTIAKPHANSRIPVVCAEEGRWDEKGGFKTGSYSYPRLRSLLIKKRQTRKDLQEKIWQEIQRKMTATKTRSATSSMHDIFNNLADEIDRYLEDFQSMGHGTIGLIGSAGSRILGCDILRNSNIYKKIEKKLIKSYALDALEYMHKGNGQANVDEFLVMTFAALNKKKPARETQNITIKGDGLIGQALVYQNNFVHASVFPV
jgi:hypothetical protein